MARESWREWQCTCEPPSLLQVPEDQDWGPEQWLVYKHWRPEVCPRHEVRQDGYLAAIDALIDIAALEAPIQEGLRPLAMWPDGMSPVYKIAAVALGVL